MKSQKSEPWWRQEYAWPTPSPFAKQGFAILFCCLAIGGIVGVGIDSTIWFLGGIGLLLASAGLTFLRVNLDARILNPFQIALVLTWGLAALRWTFCDEIVLAVWIYLTGFFLLWRFNRR